MDRLLVSIVTVVRNGESFIEETFKSINEQTYENIEHIVIDGDSTDGTIDIIKKYENNIRYWISEPDNGQTDALIKGFAVARGDIFCWLNYDDLFYDKNTIKNIVKEFEYSRNIDLIYGDDLLVDENLNTLKIRSFANHSFKKLLYYKSISQPSAFFTRKAYEECRLNRDLDYSMDLDLWLKIFSKYNIKYLNAVLSKNRIHDERKMTKFIREARRESTTLRCKYGANKYILWFISSLFYVYRTVKMA